MANPTKVFWLYGRSGAGKTTLARRLQAGLHDRKIPVIYLDGDEMRSTLCSDLGFKSEARLENHRRIAEIAKLLDGDPTLRVFVVGHTDMVGDAAANLSLSQSRAQSVIKALVSKHGIAASRLVAFGNGPYAPVSSNRTDEGRAQNRRVELVEIPAK